MATERHHAPLDESQKLPNDWEKQVADRLDHFLEETVNFTSKSRNWDDDDNLYVGVGGIVYTLNFVGETEKSKDLLAKAKENFTIPTEKSIHPRRLSPVAGQSSVLFLSSLPEIAQSTSSAVDSAKHYIALSSITPKAEQEILYGRAGYLWGLLAIKQAMHRANQGELNSAIDDAIRITINEIYNFKSSSSKDDTIIHCEWHDTRYIGFAHGISGVCGVLLECFAVLKDHERSRLLQTIKYIRNTYIYPSGNYKSSSDSSNDRLVHFCHGAPGIVLLYLKAYQVTKDDTYRKWAEEAGDVVWKRGLLKTSNSLCHGISGNGLILLRIYQATKDAKWLNRSRHFAAFLLNAKPSRPPDSPYSLFEGLCGPIGFFYSILHPDDARIFTFV